MNSNRSFLLVFIFLTFSFLAQGQGLIAYYPFDNNTADFSGNNNDGTFHGGVKATTDRFGKPCGAIQFNGKDGYISVPNSTSLQSPKNSLSVSVWFKLDSAPSQRGNRWLSILCKGSEREEQYYNPQYRIQVYQSPIQSTVSLSTDFTEYDTNFVANAFPYGQWLFYVLVYDGQNVTSFVNGNKIWEFPYANIFFKNDNPLDIGRDMPGNIEYFCGALDELRIFNTALTQDEIRNLFTKDIASAAIETIDLTCPIDIIVPNDIGKCSAKVNFNKAAVDYNCGNANVKQIGGLTSGSSFPIGVSKISFETKSRTGVTKVCDVNVTVLDQEPPVIDCLRDTVLKMNDKSSKGVVFNYKTPLAKDNCSHASLSKSEGLPSGSTFPEGKNTIRFIAVDEANNKKECAFNVYVTSSENATIISSKSCLQDIVKSNDPLQCGAIVNYEVLDNKYTMVEGIASGRFFPVGLTTIKLQKKLSGNLTEECMFTVDVRDNEKPYIHCQEDINIEAIGTETSAIVNYLLPETSDNCKVDSLYITHGFISGSRFPLGTTPVSYRAIDATGNSAECSFNVRVINKNARVAINTEKTLTKPYLPDKVVYTPDLKFKKCMLTLLLYDDGQEDNDTVSVYFNGDEIVSREMIRLRDHHIIVRSVSLVSGKRNDFIVRAWNNGSISPNTIKIEFYEGNHNDNALRLRKQKPARVRVLHSHPGVAGAISIQCSAR